MGDYEREYLEPLQIRIEVGGGDRWYRKVLTRFRPHHSGRGSGSRRGGNLTSRSFYCHGGHFSAGSETKSFFCCLQMIHYTGSLPGFHFDKRVRMPCRLTVSAGCCHDVGVRGHRNADLWAGLDTCTPRLGASAGLLADGTHCQKTWHCDLATLSQHAPAIQFKSSCRDHPESMMSKATLLSRKQTTLRP